MNTKHQSTVPGWVQDALRLMPFWPILFFAVSAVVCITTLMPWVVGMMMQGHVVPQTMLETGSFLVALSVGPLLPGLVPMVYFPVRRAYAKRWLKREWGMITEKVKLSKPREVLRSLALGVHHGRIQREDFYRARDIAATFGHCHADDNIRCFIHGVPAGAELILIGWQGSRKVAEDEG